MRIIEYCLSWTVIHDEILKWAAAWENQQFAYVKTKAQKLISAFAFVTGIVQFLFFLSVKFQASDNCIGINQLR